MELFRVTDDPKYLATARGAFAYEDTLFDSTVGNWVDARFPFERSPNGRIEGTFATAWCHGAGGTALARLRAAAIDTAQATPHREWAARALARVQIAVDEYASIDRYDTSLCHGILGLSEVLLIAGQWSGNSAYVQKSCEVAGRMVMQYGKANDWPCGSSGEIVHPSFMLGVSGIGHHLLRVAGCEVEPVLALVINQREVSHP